MFKFTPPDNQYSDEKSINETLTHLKLQKTRGDLGAAIAAVILSYSPRDLETMRWNFTGKIQSYNAELRKELEETVTTHLLGTYQQVRLMNQQGSFAIMTEPAPEASPAYWEMVRTQCTGTGKKGSSLRFLKYLLSGFCMLVQQIPGHPVGMPFPGGDRVIQSEGAYYCPVRTKANDVDAALCPFCPAEQTPEVGYLKPPVDGSRNRKQEFIRNCYDHHHFNG
jgi:uncharacterized protein (UPF0305 family)